ncbi:MAG: glycosyltransferase [Puniceicoccales bacterium]|jgi:glycosyltransferase involved in cell wall biosynthesis|nr:glycosyltransferase [Puniceicoccales bacterium]
MTVANIRPLLGHEGRNSVADGSDCNGAVAEEPVWGGIFVPQCGAISALFQNMPAVPEEDGMPSEKKGPTLPQDLFFRLPAAGAPILQKYLDALPVEDRYAAFEPLVRKHWKWLCQAAPYLKFPKPKPVLEGQRVNIGIWVWRLTGDGIGRVMQLVANHYARDPMANVTLFISNDQAKKIDFVLHPNVTVVRVPSIGGGGGNWPELMEEYPQDVIICPEHYLVENMRNILLLKSLGIRVIAQEHNFILCRQPFTSLAGKFAHLLPLYSCCDAITCLSRVDLYKWCKKGLRNAVFLPNPPTFVPERVTPSSHLTKNILWVGRWTRWVKRPDLAIRVFAQVYEKVPDARLIMLGEHYNSAYYLECRRLADELGVGHAVDIVGFQRDMEPYYANGAVLLSTSRVEGCPMVAIEAKAHGVPVVSTSMPWVEVLQNGCIQTPQGDEVAMVEALVDLLQNSEKRRQLGEEGRRDIRANFSDDVVFAKYDDLIRAVLIGPGAVNELCASGPPLDSETLEDTLARAIEAWGK